MHTAVRKRPDVDFVVRLVGQGIRPWAVPVRALARILEAVQRLVDARASDYYAAQAAAEPPAVGPITAESAQSLRLLTVKSGSACYAVAAPDRKAAIGELVKVGCEISSPDSADWNEATLSSVQELSEVAKSLGCEIEFLSAPRPNRSDRVLARITPCTYDDIAESAFIRGQTSVFARIERVGGATDMHCGIRIPESPQKMVICGVTSEELTRALGQHIYQHVLLTGLATWIRHNWRLKRIEIESFEPPKSGSLVAALRGAHEAGGSAWDEIEDPGSYMATVRS